MPTLSLDVRIPKSLIDRFSDKKFKPLLAKLHSDLVEQSFRFWKREAARRLKASRYAYLEGLELTWGKDGSASISVNGIASLFEYGGPSFDMRPGFLRHDYVRNKNLPRRGEQLSPIKKNKEGKRYRRLFINTYHLVNFDPATRTGKRGKFVTVTQDSPGWRWNAKASGAADGPNPVPINLRKYVKTVAINEIRPKLVEKFKADAKKLLSKGR